MEEFDLYIKGLRRALKSVPSSWEQQNLNKDPSSGCNVENELKRDRLLADIAFQPEWMLA